MRGDSRGEVRVPKSAYYGAQTQRACLRSDASKDTARGLQEVALGSTAVSTGINTHPQFAAQAIKIVSGETGLPFRERRITLRHRRDGMPRSMSTERSRLGGEFDQNSYDLRWLASGPRCAIGEIELPDTARSSITPGKVNPVVCE